MSRAKDLDALPIVRDRTSAQSENIQTVWDRVQNGRIVIPDYQRDADQWDDGKESLFIESVLNNLTIPAFFFLQQEDGTIEVVDGQQRLKTIQKFRNGELAISDDEDMVYLVPQSVLYKGKKYTQLPKKLQGVFDDYPLTIIYLPKNIDLSTKLEIFRRINEGGTPLTSQDIRLAYYSESNSVFYIRLAGLYSESDAAKRMLESGAKRGITNPWPTSPEATNYWQEWWQDKAKAKGQTPSEMFLWYLVARDRDKLNTLLSSPDSIKHLQITFRGTTEEALDIYCAQLLFTDQKGKTPVFPTYGNGLEAEFAKFAKWIEQLLSRELAGLSVDKYKQMALLIAAAVELDVKLNKVSDTAWNAVADFMRKPRQAGDKWLRREGGYPEQKGRWGGEKGQKVQSDRVVTLLEHILKAHP